MNTVLFFFSGTGNTFAIANKLANRLGDATVMPINRIKHINLSSYERVGFLFPVYALHTPSIVLDLLKDITLNKNQRVFLIATYAGSRGYAVEEVCTLLSKKNPHSIQEFCIRMPGNYLLEYGAFPNRLQKILIKSANKKLKKIEHSIRTNKTTRKIKANLLALLFKKESLKMIESFTDKGMLFYTNSNCTHCNTCISLCPTANIAYENQELKWGNKCTQCMACIQWCPNNAISHPNLKSHRRRYHHPDVNITYFKVN